MLFEHSNYANSLPSTLSQIITNEDGKLFAIELIHDFLAKMVRDYGTGEGSDTFSQLSSFAMRILVQRGSPNIDLNYLHMFDLEGPFFVDYVSNFF